MTGRVLPWRSVALPGLLAFVALLAGCAALREDTARPRPSSEAERALYDLREWRMEGRIGVQTPEDAWQANLFWDHDPTQDRLRVSGPLSQGMVSIVVQKDLIYINEGGGVTELSRDPDATLRKRLGFAVPLSSLRYWMLGIPDLGQPYTPLPASQEAPSGFRQAGWTIRIDRLIDVGHWRVPHRLSVQGGGVRLRIIGDDWQIKG